MDWKNSSNFGVFDYCLFAGVLIISSFIGLFVSWKGNKTPEEFLLGNRSFKPLPVSMSLLNSYVSAISLLGYSGEVYANGLQISTITLGMVLGIIFSLYFLIPMLYSLKLLSTNEYIELRFKSKRLCLTIFLLSIASSFLIKGIALYAQGIALAAVMNIDIITGMIVFGTICTIYSAFGGMKAVIWTDAFQFIVMVIGLVSLLAVSVAQNGGIIETLYTASKGGRLEMFDFNLSPFVRHTFFNTVSFGFFNYSFLYSSCQTNLQRICSVKSLKYAKRVISYNIFGISFMYFLILSCGVVAYSTFAGCDPMAMGIIKKKEQIIPYFVMNKLNYIGLPGIFVGTIIGASMSSISSTINGSVAQIWRDVFLRFDHFKTASPSYSTLINKIISLLIGFGVIGMAILTSKGGGVVEVSFVVMGSFNGPIFGVFLVGFFLPRCNSKGIWTGFITSSALTTWLALGGVFYRKRTKMLPFSVDECNPLNMTSPNMNMTSLNMNMTSLINNSFVKHNSFMNGSIEDTGTESFFVQLYQISYTLNAVIGPVTCVFLAVIVSWITGNQKIQETSPKFIAPFVRKFYWTKEELIILEEDVDSFQETNFDTLHVDSSQETKLDSLEVSKLDTSGNSLNTFSNCFKGNNLENLKPSKDY
ncbi:UNVERIFIED_CONTAM: hypothetical protein RMT77_013822 [Armadillidium vulgare]